MAVYAESTGRRQREQTEPEHRTSGEWGAVAAEALIGFALRVVALLIIAGALFALIAAAGIAQPVWLAPADEQPRLIPSPWSGQDGA